MPACPPPAALAELLAPAGGDPTVAAHLDTCPACQAALDAFTSPSLAPPPADAFAAEPALGRVVAALVAADPALPERVGPYRVLGVLGRGGMGVVFRGRDDRVGRDVAVKVLRPEVADAAGRERFRREGGAAAAVRHEHVVVLHEMGDLPDGSAFLAMEYVPGGTLRDRVRDGGPLPARDAAARLAEAAAGVAAAHAAGLVHRDLKPANMLLDAATGRAKVADFGLARPAGDAAALTARGDLLGTPAYMAPEQADRPDAADARTDVYGLGATLYEALTGAAPFRGPVAQVLAQLAADDPVPPRRLNPGVPRDLETVCLRAMAKEPARRYPTAAAFADDLGRWLRGEPVVARPVGWVGRARRWAGRNRTAAALAGALVVLVPAAFAVVVALWLRADVSAAAERGARAEADADYRRAAGVVDRFYAALYREGTLAAPVSLETRRELIREAIGFYEDIAARRPGQKSPAELGLAYARLGWMHNQLRDPDAALAAYRTAAAHLAAAPDREAAECQFYLGVTAARLGRAADAAAAYEDAAARFRRLLAPAPADEALRQFLAGSLGNAAAVYEFRGEVGKALAAHAEARDVLAGLHREHPKNAQHFQDVFWETQALGELDPDPAAGLKWLEAADGLAAGYAKAFPTDFTGVRIRCAGRSQLARGLLRAGRAADAAAPAKAAAGNAATLAKFPAPYDAPGTQAGAWAVLGEVETAAGNATAGEEAWKKAAALYEPLPRRSVADAVYAGRLAAVYDRLAAAADRRGDAAEAARRRAAAAAARANLRAAHPGIAEPF